jgi:uncharacterized protein YndB with AHSA1/START domain
MTPPPRSVERELRLAAPPAAVWRALTDARELTRWFPLDARVTPGPGGAIWMSWASLYEAESRIEAWEPPRHLRLAFPVHPPLLLATDYHLETAAGGTVLRVVTSGFGDDAAWDRMYGGVSRGWDFELLGLRHYLERHPGRDRAVAHARIPMRSAAEAWAALAGPGGWLPVTAPRAGGRYAITTATGEAMAGTVLLRDPPHQVAVTVDGMGDALLRAEVETHTADVTATVWLSTWRLPPAEVTELERRWRARLPEVLAAAAGP